MAMGHGAEMDAGGDAINGQQPAGMCDQRRSSRIISVKELDVLMPKAC